MKMNLQVYKQVFPQSITIHAQTMQHKLSWLFVSSLLRFFPSLLLVTMPKESIRKPKAGLRITNYKPEQSTKGLPKGFLNLKASEWTSPSRVVKAIKGDIIRYTPPKNAYDNILTAFNAIKNSEDIPEQVKAYAVHCHAYALSPEF